MSAVKSQFRNNLLNSTYQYQGPSAPQPHQALGHQRPVQDATSTSSAYPNPAFQQNLRRMQCTMPGASANRFGYGPDSASGFTFIQAAGDAQVSAGAADCSSAAAGISTTEKKEMVEALKQFVHKYSEAKIWAELDLANWNSGKALAKMMKQLHDDEVQANQERLTDVHATYSQARASCGSQAQPDSASSFSSNYNVPKASKRRRTEFEGNTKMQSTNVSPNRNIPPIAAAPATSPAQLSQEQSPSSSVASAQQVQGAQPVQIDQQATRQYGQNIAQQVSTLLGQYATDGQKQELIAQALEHYADVASKQQLSQQAQQLAQVQQQLNEAQKKLSRHESDNKVLLRGFNGMMKRQTEYCSTKESNALLNKENERLRYDVLFLRAKLQPSQASFSSLEMQTSRRHFDDVM